MPSYFSNKIFSSKFRFTNYMFFRFILIFSKTWDVITLLFNTDNLKGSISIKKYFCLIAYVDIAHRAPSVRLGLRMWAQPAKPASLIEHLSEQ